MHQNVNCGGVEPVEEAPVEEAPIGLYTKLRKTRTFETDVMQKKKTHWKAFKLCTYIYIWLLVPISLN